MFGPAGQRPGGGIESGGAVGAGVAASETKVKLPTSARHPATTTTHASKPFTALGRVPARHNGGTVGFRSFIGFTDKQAGGVLILSNTSEFAVALATALLRGLFGSASERNVAGEGR